MTNPCTSAILNILQILRAANAEDARFSYWDTAKEKLFHIISFHAFDAW